MSSRWSPDLPSKVEKLWKKRAKPIATPSSSARSASYRGVEFAHAVHGGRELRVYVRERDVDDLAVIDLSAEIAARIADELTFPGQIKVTVIRSFAAIATAS